MNVNGKLTSYDQAQIAVAGALLIDAPKAYELVSRHITADCFSLETCRTIYETVGHLLEKNLTADPVTIRNAAADAGKVLTGDTLFQYMEVTPTAANAEAYAELVKQGALRAKINALCEQAQTAGELMPVEELAGEMLAGLTPLVNGIAKKGTLSTQDAYKDLLDSLADKALGKAGFVPTGFPNLDRALGGGFVDSSLNIVAGRPGMGKSVVAVNLAEQMAAALKQREPGAEVLFCSMEMDSRQVTARRLARVTRLSSSTLTVNGIQKDDAASWADLADGYARLSDNIVLMTDTRPTVAEIAFKARSLKNCKMILIDHLGLLKGDGRRISRYEEVSEISRSLKELAMSMRIPVIALCQLNRQNEQRGDRRPQMSDLRDSGAIEQDADSVILLHRPDYYDADAAAYIRDNPQCPSELELILSKNRHGAAGFTIRYECWLFKSLMKEVRER